jgi:hypothetical protein
MKSGSKVGLLLSGVLLATLTGQRGVLAGPKPATRPAPAAGPTTKPAPAGWVRIDNKGGHFHFSVPPAWKADRQSDALSVFVVPHAKHQPPVLFAVSSAACHASTVEADAADFRDGLKSPTGPTAGAKLTRDAATTLGGRPAWDFEWLQPLVAMPSPAAHAKSAAAPKATNHVMQLMRAEGNMHYILTFQGDATGYAANLATAKRVLDTLTWDADPITAPAH